MSDKPVVDEEADDDARWSAVVKALGCTAELTSVVPAIDQLKEDVEHWKRKAEENERRRWLRLPEDHDDCGVTWAQYAGELGDEIVEIGDALGKFRADLERTTRERDHQAALKEEAQKTADELRGARHAEVLRRLPEGIVRAITASLESEHGVTVSDEIKQRWVGIVRDL